MARDTTVSVAAEMVANVLEVPVSQGQQVAVGETVVLLESMKMEIPVLAEVAGRVTAINFAPGDVVQEGDVLVVLTRAG
ncbi:biotin/lipoyl-binding carrier protein [Nocardioides sp. Y6]|uniref:Biotin/lipoyl-binding carrier protein n=1 Tax=Nocardioides malaquae TaxID=2773426 RepID=A0ABR9RRB9_9ACTN|nr:biotin/lipoyl-binding carrier protein [Nocardioides malaquae]MBE7324127.1 biotin/lipoyl-binding carrier protein [Nocardioides malaquae]